MTPTGRVSVSNYHRNSSRHQTQNNTKSVKLHKAVEYRNIHKVKILLPEEENINDKNDKGYTVLLLACEQDNDEILDLILTHKDIDIEVTNKEGFHALHILAFRGNLNGIQKVLKRFPNADIEAVTDKGNTPLVMASKMDHVDVIEFLASKGANIKHKNAKSFTALHYAANNGYIRSLEALIKLGADINARDDYGLTPLMKACKWGFRQSCEILLQKGADVNVANRFGQVALKSGCFRDYVDVVKLLISFKADVNYPGPFSMALFECAKRGNVACAGELIKAGANVTGKKRNGKTVLNIARQNKQYEFVNLVEEYFL